MTSEIRVFDQEISIEDRAIDIVFQGYDLENERMAISLAGFGEGTGALLVAINDVRKVKDNFKLGEEIAAFNTGLKLIIQAQQNNTSIHFMMSDLLVAYLFYSPSEALRSRAIRHANEYLLNYDQILKTNNREDLVALAMRGTLPAEVECALAQHPLSEVREALVNSGNLSSMAQIILASDVDPFIRRELSDIRHLDYQALKILCHDPDSQIQQDVLGGQNLPEGLGEELINENDTKLLLAMANYCDDPDILELLAKHPLEPIRIAVVLNSGIDRAIMKILATDTPAVRQHLKERTLPTSVANLLYETEQKEKEIGFV